MSIKLGPAGGAVKQQAGSGIRSKQDIRNHVIIIHGAILSIFFEYFSTLLSFFTQ